MLDIEISTEMPVYEDSSKTTAEEYILMLKRLIAEQKSTLGMMESRLRKLENILKK